MIDEKQIRKGALIVFGTFIACVALYMGAISYGLSSKEKENDERIPVPITVATEECELKTQEGKNLKYKCKTLDSEKVRPEAVNHYNELYDSCVTSPYGKNLILCYKEDAIKKIERKVRMTSVTYDTGHKKYIRH